MTMKLKTLKQTKTLLFVEVEGESIGFTNLIEEELWNDKNVDEAAYIKEHPYMVEPKIYVKIKGRTNPRKSIEKANKRILVQLKHLEKEFKRAQKD